MHLLLASITLPTFPTVDLAAPIEWLFNGFTALVSSNAGLAITAGLGMAFLPMAIRKIKGFGKSAVK